MHVIGRSPFKMHASKFLLSLFFIRLNALLRVNYNEWLKNCNSLGTPYQPPPPGSSLGRLGRRRPLPQLNPHGSCGGGPSYPARALTSWGTLCSDGRCNRTPTRASFPQVVVRDNVVDALVAPSRWPSPNQRRLLLALQWASGLAAVCQLKVVRRGWSLVRRG